MVHLAPVPPWPASVAITVNNVLIESSATRANNLPNVLGEPADYDGHWGVQHGALPACHLGGRREREHGPAGRLPRHPPLHARLPFAMFSPPLCRALV